MILLDFFLHIDTHLAAVIEHYGVFTYVILLLVIFCETGLVVTPFLPGDSLLFAAGAFAAQGVLNPHLLFILLTLAAVIGDTVNYAVGAFFGPRVFRENVRFLKREYLLRAEAFYEKHGGKTIILARFIPIVRTFAPFVAGVGKMHYLRFLSYNVFGGTLWVALFIYGGYFFGTIPIVQENFEWVILGIIAISLLPPVLEWMKHRRSGQ
jgi:membrane-associated protein